MADFFNQASAAMTVISLTTFIGILWWACSRRRGEDFDAASRIPFMDDEDAMRDYANLNAAKREQRHV